MSATKTVFLSIPGAFAVASLLRSDVLPILRQGGLQIMLISPYAKEPSFVSEFGEPGKAEIRELKQLLQTPRKPAASRWLISAWRDAIPTVLLRSFATISFAICVLWVNDIYWATIYICDVKWTPRLGHMASLQWIQERGAEWERDEPSARSSSSKWCSSR